MLTGYKVNERKEILQSFFTKYALFEPKKGKAHILNHK